MRRVDSRRLTGPNLLWDRPGAVIDARFEDVDPDTAIEAWRGQAMRMLAALGWQTEKTCARRFRDGASLAISAPVDVLYTATEVNEWAFDAACDVLRGGPPQPSLDEGAERLKEAVVDERNPRLLVLKAAAAERGKPVLIDTRHLSIGMGRYSQTWPLDDLPAPDRVPWHYLKNIPLALITGTNGKTTSARLAAAVGRAAGFTVGLSSTDWIAAGEKILDRGDYAGPEGARTVLRNPEVDLAVLETARGGLLRRGLAVERADAVLITNVAADHLGEFGVQTVDELADVKWIATRALGEGAALVLNADDPRLVSRAKGAPSAVTWFSPDPDQALLQRHARDGGAVCTVVDQQITLIRGGRSETLLPVAAVPITLNGAAGHNVYNALGVVALADALGLPTRAITDGLRAVGPNDNPGRGNLYTVNGASFVVDFAHNPHGMAAFVGMVGALPARRRVLLIGQAGDRSDEDIRNLVASACAIPWDRVVIKRMDKYARGREGGEVAGILHDEFVRRGVAEQRIEFEQYELDAVKHLVESAETGDLIVLLIHESRSDVLDHLDAASTAH